jgi:hypothetical protein
MHKGKQLALSTDHFHAATTATTSMKIEKKKKQV